LLLGFLAGDSENYISIFIMFLSESIRKIEEIGPYDVNTHRMYIKFGCYPEETKGET
jgi:hypothetical protein